MAYTVEEAIRRARQLALQSEVAPLTMIEIVKVADMALGEKTILPHWMTGKSRVSEGTWFNGGKEWAPDEVSFKARWDKAKQLLKPEDLEEVVITDDMVTKGAKGIWNAGGTGVSFELAPRSVVDGLMSQARAALIGALKP